MLRGKRNCRKGGNNGRSGLRLRNQLGDSTTGLGVGVGGISGMVYDLTSGL